MHKEGSSEEITDSILAELDHFVGDRWEQEDDITLVALERVSGNATRPG